MRIGVFGGTFDPPHRGHLEIAVKVLEKDLVDQVLLVPCYRHAFGKDPVGFDHRVGMCERLVAHLPRVRISRIEERMDKPGRTLELVTLLEQEHPGDELRLIAGADIYHERHKWYRYDDVAAKAKPIYLAREGTSPIPEPTLSAPVGVSSSQVRAALARGGDVSALLSRPVVEYIDHNNLYGRRRA